MLQVDLRKQTAAGRPTQELAAHRAEIQGVKNQVRWAEVTRWTPEQVLGRTTVLRAKLEEVRSFAVELMPVSNQHFIKARDETTRIRTELRAVKYAPLHSASTAVALVERSAGVRARSELGVYRREVKRC